MSIGSMKGIRRGLGLQGFDLGQQFDAARLVASLQLGFERGNLFRPRPPQRHPPRHRAAHGAADRNIGRRARGRIAGAANSLALHFGQLALGEIGQFQIVEEQVDEFVAAQNEPERILAVALARAASLAARLVRARQDVAFDELLVAGKHHVAGAAFTAKARLVHAVERYADLAAFQDILDVPVLRGFLDRTPEPAPWPGAGTADGSRGSCCPDSAAGRRCEWPPLSHPPQPACFTRMYHSTSRRTWRSV